jgi:hypothetical protein
VHGTQIRAVADGLLSLTSHAPRLFMSYTFEELDIILEALTYLENRILLSKTQLKRIADLTDKVVKDQSSKAEA